MSLFYSEGTSTKMKLDSELIENLQDMANRLRIHCINSIEAARLGNPSSCSSVAEILTVLFFYTMRYKLENIKDIENDRFILSKRQAAPILYAALAEAGAFPEHQLENLREIDTNLEGHQASKLDYLDVSIGSLGQGLSVACGMAFVGKYYDGANYRVYCLIGDGECAEGSIWEAVHFAGYYNLNNLCAIFDINRIGQLHTSSVGYNLDVYQKRLEAFGWKALSIDGHNVKEIANAFDVAMNIEDKPTAIIAKTVKGKNFINIGNTESWHGKPLGDKAKEVLDYLNGIIKVKPPVQLYAPEPIKCDIPIAYIKDIQLTSPPTYEINTFVSTCFAYGTALAKIAQNNNRVIALEGDMKNCTYSEKIKQIDPTRFIECFSAEQNMVGVAVGATCRNRTVAFVSTYASFFSKAFDQIRMGAASQTNVNFVGSHCGISSGEDGPSQMGLEDIAMFRLIPECTIFYPSDAVSCERAVELAANTAGVCYIRTTRPETAVIYPNDHEFAIGRANVLMESFEDKALVITAGITLYNTLKAARSLAEIGINVRVMDLFTIKPIDAESIISNALETQKRIVTIEDHFSEGGLGEAVLSVVAEERDFVVQKLAVPVTKFAQNAKDVLDLYSMGTTGIVGAIRDVFLL